MTSKSSSLPKCVIFAAAFLSFLPSVSHAGNISGGGDPRRFYFESGKALATRILTGINPNAFDPFVDVKVRTWILAERTALVTDLQASILGWTENAREQVTCARTAYQPSAVIQLSFPRCSVISSDSEAGKLLVHEAVHHRGVRDEAFADAVATAVFATWQYQLETSIPLCDLENGGDLNDPRGNVIAPRLTGEWEVDPDLYARLGLTDASVARMTFRRDVSVLDKLSPIGSCAVSAGTLVMQSSRPNRAPETMTYVLTVAKGSPALITYRTWFDENGKANVNANTYFISLAPAPDNRNDIFFFGGDTLRETPVPYRRVR